MADYGHRHCRYEDIGGVLLRPLGSDPHQILLLRLKLHSIRRVDPAVPMDEGRVFLRDRAEQCAETPPICFKRLLRGLVDPLDEFFRVSWRTSGMPRSGTIRAWNSDPLSAVASGRKRSFALMVELQIILLSQPFSDPSNPDLINGGLPRRALRNPGCWLIDDRCLNCRTMLQDSLQCNVRRKFGR